MMIRKGIPEDAGAMARIFNHYIRTSTAIFSNDELSADDMKQKLERLEVGSKFPFLVSVDNQGAVNGYCYAHRWMPDAVYDRSWELTMYLDHRSLGRGIGSKMFNELIEECSKGGAHVLVANITEGNEASIRMCTARGFKEVGRMPEIGYKFGRYLTDVIFQKVL